MAIVIAKSAATLAKALIRRNVVGVVATSTKEMLSQAKVVDKHEEVMGDHGNEVKEHQSVQLPQEEKYRIHMQTSEDSLRVNLEHVSNDLQRELIEQLGPMLRATADEEQIPNVTFNYLAEEIFINNLYMTLRKLGYEGTFTRYNDDKGLATFKMIDPEEETLMKKYSFFRSTQPNLC